MNSARMVRVALAAGMLAVLGLVAVPDFLDSGASLERVRWAWLAPALVLELVSMGMFVRMRRRLLRSGGMRVPLCRVGAVTLAGNAISLTAPAGPALSAAYVYRQMRRVGATTPLVAWTLVAGGVLSGVGFAAVAVLGSALTGSASVGSLAGTVLGSVLMAAAVVALLGVVTHHPDGVARAVTSVQRRVPRRWSRRAAAPASDATGGVARLVADVSAIAPRRRDWAVTLGFATLNWAADLGAFLLCLHAVGLSATSLQVGVLAYIAGMATSGLSLLPGGLGGLEAAMLVTLTHGGVVAGAAAAAVLTYRIVGYAFLAVLGWVAWWVLRRRGAHTDDAGGENVGAEEAGATDEAWTVAPAAEGPGLSGQVGPVVAAA